LSIASEFVGKNSPQPNKQLYKDDWNNFAPSIGLSWSLPYFGKDKTVLRAGYGISYQGGGRGFTLDSSIGSFPGVNQFVTQRPGTTYIDVSTVNLPIPGKAPAGQLPIVPLTARNDVITTWDPNMVTPYIQNFNVDLQRTLSRDLTMSVRYIGTKGTKLLGGVNLNDVNIFENGILDAFNTTRAGGDAPLFDQMLKGLVMNTGQPAVGTNGVTGSAALRQNTIFRGFLANGNVGQFASALNTQTTVTGQAGGLVRNGGLPENFIVVNPQFSSVRLDTNLGNSTYHSMNVQITKRLSHGLTSQTAYTWSRTLGEASDDGQAAYLNPRNRSLNKTLLSFHRTQSFRSNGTFELPFGPGRPFLSSAPGLLTRLVGAGGWEDFQLDFRGASNGTAATSTFTQSTGHGHSRRFPQKHRQDYASENGGTYFAGFTQVVDPARAGVTTAQTLQSQFGFRDRGFLWKDHSCESGSGTTRHSRSALD
jgi:hypothetical protein